MTKQPERPGITCPRCGMTSYHPVDIEQGYCANCREWTSPPRPPKPKESK